MSGLRVLLTGATGSAGRAVAAALAADGHRVVAPVRHPAAARAVLPEGVVLRRADVSDPGALARDGLAGERVDAFVSCLASRTGEARNAWALDHRATVDALGVAVEAGASHAVLLSALCVQRPELAFQHAKLTAEAAFRASGVGWTIVRPTAFFKSLSGQVARVRAGRPFLVFGDGRLTATKPISDGDLGRFVADCLTDPGRMRRTLPIGGPGPAITPLDQAAMLERLLGRPVPVRRVPVTVLSGIAGVLGAGGRLSPALARKAGLARIGRHYATRSMLVWTADAGRYDAEATPEFGHDRLEDHYARLLTGEATDDRGAHAVF